MTDNSLEMSSFNFLKRNDTLIEKNYGCPLQLLLRLRLNAVLIIMDSFPTVIDSKWNDNTLINPCPAEPGYTLPLQTV